MIHLTINSREFEAEEGMTVLQAAAENGIRIPTLCYHKALKSAGTCKLCAVEIKSRKGKPIIGLACLFRVREGLEVKTESQPVTRARVKAFKNLLSMAPQADRILKLAEEFGVDVGPQPDGCVRCRLCIRVCREIVGPGALRMEKRGWNEFVVPNEGRCIGCGTCVNICPTGAIRMRDEEDTRIITIRDEVIGVHHLERCESCGLFFASQKFVAHVQERVIARHPDVKEPHIYCPACAKNLSSRVTSYSKPVFHV